MTPVRSSFQSLAAAVLCLLLTSSGAARNERPGKLFSGSTDDSVLLDKKNQETKAATCVTHTTQARFIMGFDHLVHLKSECERAASCKVSTDVNPEIHHVTLKPGESKTILTYRGSPAREFQATVECTLVGNLKKK